MYVPCAVQHTIIDHMLLTFFHPPDESGRQTYSFSSRHNPSHAHIILCYQPKQSQYDRLTARENPRQRKNVLPITKHTHNTTIPRPLDPHPSNRTPNPQHRPPPHQHHLHPPNSQMREKGPLQNRPPTHLARMLPRNPHPPSQPRQRHLPQRRQQQRLPPARDRALRPLQSHSRAGRIGQRGEQLGGCSGGAGPAESSVPETNVAGGSDGRVAVDGAGGEDQGVAARAG